MKPRPIVFALILLAAIIGASACMNSKSSQAIDNLVPLLAPERVPNYDRNVVWASPEGRDIVLDVSWPDGDGPFPVLVWIHGGSWEFFSKEANEGLARYLTNRGYVVFNINYRMAPEVTMKTIIEDAMGAVIWAKDHAAEYHGDPQRLAVAGHSAGGHLAAMVAVACGDPFFSPTYTSLSGFDCKPAAAIPVSGLYNLVQRDPAEPDNWPRIFGVPEADDPDLYRRCSPVTYLRPDLPPELVVYAGDEGLRAENEEWVKLLQAIGAPVESYMQPDEEHIWVVWHFKRSAKTTFDRMAQFLDEKLRPTSD